MNGIAMKSKKPRFKAGAFSFPSFSDFLFSDFGNLICSLGPPFKLTEIHMVS